MQRFTNSTVEAPVDGLAEKSGEQWPLSFGDNEPIVGVLQQAPNGLVARSGQNEVPTIRLVLLRDALGGEWDIAADDSAAERAPALAQLAAAAVSGLAPAGPELRRKPRELAFAGRPGVVADPDPLSLLCRLVALVPAPRFHTVRYFGVLAAAAKWRPLIVPKAGTETCPSCRASPRERRAARLLRLGRLSDW